jgi:hypothetical protein
LDVALFFPSLIAALYSLIASQMGMALPASATEIGSDVLLLTLLASLGYCAVSSLTGTLPDKIPFISNAVKSRVPSVDQIQVVFMQKKDEDDKKKD